MIICITGMFQKYDKHRIPTEEKELLVSHGIDDRTGRNVCLPCDHPIVLGAKFDTTLQKWVLPGE